MDDRDEDDDDEGQRPGRRRAIVQLSDAAGSVSTSASGRASARRRRRRRSPRPTVARWRPGRPARRCPAPPRAGPTSSSRSTIVPNMPLVVTTSSPTSRPATMRLVGPQPPLLGQDEQQPEQREGDRGEDEGIPWPAGHGSRLALRQPQADSTRPAEVVRRSRRGWPPASAPTRRRVHARLCSVVSRWAGGLADRVAGGGGSPATSVRTPGTGSVGSSGSSSVAQRALRMLSRPASVRIVPWRAEPGRQHAVEQVDALGDGLDHAGRVAQAHHVAGPVRRAARPARRRCAGTISARDSPTENPPMPKPSNPSPPPRFSAVRAAASARRASVDAALHDAEQVLVAQPAASGQGPGAPGQRCARRPAARPPAATAAAGTRRAASGCRRRAPPGWRRRSRA